MGNERQRRPGSTIALDDIAASPETGEWQPAPGKVTRTMRIAERYGEALIRRKAAGDAPSAIAGVFALLDASSEARLPGDLRDELSSALGRDLDDVRIHTDRAAADAARALNARAFAIGDHVYFGDGAYQPDSDEGRRLIAHEVAHTVQQGGATGLAVEVSRPGDAHEIEADRFADAFAAAPKPSRAAAEPSRVLPATAFPLITPVHIRQVHRYPYDGGDPPGQGPKAPSGGGSSGGSTPAPSGGDGGEVAINISPIELFPQKSWSKSFPILKPTFIPIAAGTMMIDVVPVTYKVEGNAELTSRASASIGPATLQAGVVYVDGQSAAGMGVGDQGQEGRGPVGDEELLKQNGGTFSGLADLTFGASATASLTGSAGITAEVAAFDIFAVGGHAGLSGSASATVSASFHPRVAFNYAGGTATMMAGVDVALKTVLTASLQATAGIYVELRPPHIPVISDLYNALNSIPVVEWLLPDPGHFTWRKPFDKTFPLYQGQREWNLTRRLVVGGDSPACTADGDFTADPPDFASMMPEIAASGSALPSDDPGPDGLKDATPAAAASARAAAQAQIANATKEIEREKKWNEKAVQTVKDQKAKAAAAGGGTVNQAGMPGSGDDAEAKLATQKAALDDATSAVGKMTGMMGKAGAAASAPDSPSRAEAKAAFQSLETNAEKLGDEVAGGKGKFEHPTVTDDPAAEAKFNARRQQIQLRMDTVADPVMTETSWLDAELAASDGCSAIADYRGALAQHQQRVANLSARLDMLEKDLTDAWTESMAGDHAGALAKLEGIDQWLAQIEGQTAGLKPQRPKPTWDVDYAIPEGGQLMLRPPYRGVIRETFYPSGYRKGTKTAMGIKPHPHPVHPEDGFEYWTYMGALSPRGDNEWRMDITAESPTVDHDPPVAVHWNTAGNGIGQKARADAYNGSGMAVSPMPWSINSSKGSGGVNYDPQVKITFRGR